MRLLLNTRTFELNLSVVEVFFLEINRTAFAGTLDKSIDDKIDLRKIFPCNATLVLYQKDIERFSLHLEFFARNPAHPEIKAFVTFNQLNIPNDVLMQAIADDSCVIKMSIAFEDTEML
jgi:hypothetical protein